MSKSEPSIELKSASFWSIFKPSPCVYFSNSGVKINKKEQLETLEWDNLSTLSFFIMNPVKAPGLYKMITSGKISIHFKITGKTGESFKNRFTNVDAARMQNIVKLIIEKTTMEPQIIEGVEASLDHAIDYQGKTPRRQSVPMGNLMSKMARAVKLKWEF